MTHAEDATLQNYVALRRRIGDVLVVTPRDDAGHEIRSDVTDALSSEPGLDVVLDLSEMGIVGVEPLEAYLAALGARTGAGCVACSRPSGRELLRRWLPDLQLPVFGSVADALQARLLAGSGYGAGWARSSAS